MKTIIPLLIVSLFALGSCTEEIFIDKWLYDTIYVDKPQAIAPKVIIVTDTIHHVDTVEVRVIIREVDTVFQVITKDSLIIKEVEKIVTVLDTVILNQVDTVFLTDTLVVTQYDRTVTYLDTLYVLAFFRPVNSIPDEIKPHVIEFYTLAGQYNKFVPGGVMIVQYTDNLPGENWNSHSYWWDAPGGQMVIELNQALPPDQHRASILRELGRLQMGRKYTNIPDRIMNPTFSPTALITQNHLNQLYQ